MTDQAQKNTGGKAISSLALGIIGILCGVLFLCRVLFFYSVSWLGFGAAFGIVGLIFGIRSRKTAHSTAATAGIVLSMIAIVIIAVCFALIMMHHYALK